jgi:hypothetical protein
MQSRPIRRQTGELEQVVDDGDPFREIDELRERRSRRPRK